MHIHNNSILHYLYNVAVGLVIYSKARTFKAKAKDSRPRRQAKAKAREFQGQGQGQGQEIWP